MKLIFQQVNVILHMRPGAKAVGRPDEVRILSGRFARESPGRSPDLNPADDWLRWVLKSRFYRHHTRDLRALMHVLRRRVMLVRRDHLRGAESNFSLASCGCHSNMLPVFEYSGPFAVVKIRHTNRGPFFLTVQKCLLPFTHVTMDRSGKFTNRLIAYTESPE